MKFKVDAKKLREVLAIVVSAADVKDGGILSTLLLELVDDFTLQITGTSQSVTIQRNCPVDASTLGSACFPATKLFNISKVLDGEMDISLGKDLWAKITCGKAKYRVSTMESNRFPPVPERTGSAISLDYETLASMIKATAFAITNEESRYTLNGVKLEIANGKGKMVATDGHRVAYIEEDVKGTFNEFLPKKSLDYLTKLPKTALSIYQDENRLFFVAEDAVMITTKITGSFPNYEMVTKLPVATEFSVVAGELKKSLARILANSTDKINAITLDIRKDELTLSTVTLESGESEDSVEIEYKGANCAINLNSAFMQDFLASLSDTETLHVGFTDAKSAVVFNKGNDNYKVVLMPLR